jgi:thioredoxin 2
MSNPLNIVCPHCEAVNRVPSDKLAAHPTCGKCKQTLFDAHPIELNTNNFSKHISRNDIPVLVDFWAPWCGPCHTMAPALDAFAAANAEGIGVFKLDVDDNPKTAEKYAIRSIPTVIYFKDGKPVHTSVGALSESALQEKLAALLT